MANATKAADKEDFSNKARNNSDNWKFPEIPVHNLYQKTPFRFFPSCAIKDFEQTVSFKPADKFRSLNLLSSNFRKNFIKKKHKFLHLGLVQVAIKPLVRDGLDAPVVLCLRDARHLNFKNSLLAVVKANLSQGPIYFNCFPSFSISLTDKSYAEALTLSIRTTGIPTGVSVALTIRTVCKAMVGLNTEYLEGSVLGKTTYFHAISGTLATTQWDDVVLENDNNDSVGSSQRSNSFRIRRLSPANGNDL